MLPRVCFALLLLLTAALARLVAAESTETQSLRAKAAKGNAIAQYNLGLAYMEGQQAPVDVSEAFVWLTLAAENGSTGKALNALLSTIGEPQLAEGRRRLENHRSGLGKKAKPALRGAAPVTSTPQLGVAKSTSAPVAAPMPVGETTKPGSDELATLRDDHRQLGEELALAWKESAELKNQLAVTHTALDASNVRIAAQDAALAKLEKLSALNSAAEVAKLAAELLTARKELESIRRAAAADAVRTSDALASVNELTTERTRLLTERDALATARTKSASDAESQTRELALLRERLGSSEAAVAESRRVGSELAEVKLQLIAAKAARDTLAAEKTAADQAITRLETAHDGIAARFSEAKAALSAQEAQTQSQAAELQLARESIATSLAVEADRDAANAARLKAEANAEARAQEIAALQQRLTAASAASGAIEDTKAALRRAEFAAKESAAQITSLKARVQSLEAARLSALSEKTQVADRAKLHAAELEAARKETDSIKTRVEAKRAELARVTTERDSAEAERAKAVAMAETHGREIATLNQRLKTASAAADLGTETQGAVKKSERQIATLSSEVERLQSQLGGSESARAELAAQRLTAVNQATALRGQLQSLESDQTRLRDEKAALISQLKSANATLTSVGGQDVELRKELSARTSELQAARQSIDESREKFTASESVRRDFGIQLTAARSQLREAQATAESAQAKAAKLVDENIELKARVALSGAAEMDALRAQANAAERKAEQVLKSNLELTEENARLKATRSTAPAPVRAAPARVSTATTAAPSRPNSLAISATASNAKLAAATATGSTTPAMSRTTSPSVRSHTVMTGETLRGISAQHYGTPNRWAEILDANRDVLKDERSLTVGRILRIP